MLFLACISSGQIKRTRCASLNKHRVDMNYVAFKRPTEVDASASC